MSKIAKQLQLTHGEGMPCRCGSVRVLLSLDSFRFSTLKVNLIDNITRACFLRLGYLSDEMCVEVFEV